MFDGLRLKPWKSVVKKKIKGYEFDRLKREQLDYIVSHAWEHLSQFRSQVSSSESSQKLNRLEGHIYQYILLFQKR